MIDELDDLEAELARARFDLERSLIGADNARIRIRDLERDIKDHHANLALELGEPPKEKDRSEPSPQSPSSRPSSESQAPPAPPTGSTA